jgi:hypothetical protein
MTKGNIYTQTYLKVRLISIRRNRLEAHSTIDPKHKVSLQIKCVIVYVDIPALMRTSIYVGEYDSLGHK